MHFCVLNSYSNRNCGCVKVDLLPVKALTTKQNTPEWFLLHTFSFISSTSDNLLVEGKKW